MKYIRIVDENTQIYPYNIRNLKIDFPNTSFSSETNLEEFGIYKVYIPPRDNDLTKNYEEQLIFENNEWKINWIITDKTVEQLKELKKIELSKNKEISLNNLMKQNIIDQAQQETDVEKIKEKKELYPLWEDFEDGFSFPLELKVNYIDDQLEIRLFKCIQSHNKQLNFNPVATPALWSEIIISDGGIEAWTQPIGGDGKYPYIDTLTGNPYIVTHNGNTWQNNHQGGLNVWEPGVFGWIQI